MVQIGEKANYPDPRSDFFIREAFSANDAVYTIVNTTAKKFASIPRSVYPDQNQSVAIENSPYAKILRQPNAYLGQDGFLESIYVTKELLGEAFVWINRGDNQTTGNARYNLRPLELYTLPPQSVELVTDDNDFWAVTGYLLSVGGTKVPLNKEDVIHWKSFNPNFDPYTREHLRGFSPLRAGLKLLTGNEASKDAMVAMFQNDGAKGVLFNETLDMLSRSQKDQVESVIGKKVNNRDIKGAVATLQGKWGYIDLGQSSVDMRLLEAQDVTFARLCNLFRVSPNLFIAGQTRDNLREARKDLVTSKIIPDSMSLDDEFNRVLSRSFGGQVLVSDFTELPEMQYEMSDMNAILKDMFDRGVITANEYREQMGYEITSDPDHNKYFVQGVITPLNEAALPN